MYFKFKTPKNMMLANTYTGKADSNILSIIYLIIKLRINAYTFFKTIHINLSVNRILKSFKIV